MDGNFNAYRSGQVVRWYSRLHEIIPIEKLIFEKNKDLLKQGSVLDIGVGGGRTTDYLIGRCKTYTGIDYSENFIQVVKKKHPAASLHVMDARDLSFFTDGSFDVVNFSFNGIDYVNLEGRKKILSEIARVIKPGGLFFFSTHNKNHREFNKHPWLNKTNSLITNIKTFIKLMPFLYTKASQKKLEVYAGDYAIINDSAHNYKLMTFYTTPSFLRQQLIDNGFLQPVFFTKSAEKREDAQLDDWIFILTEKIIS